jgi:hypothetical protein
MHTLKTPVSYSCRPVCIPQANVQAGVFVANPSRLPMSLVFLFSFNLIIIPIAIGVDLKGSET